jgi:hypothetical protein
MQDLLSLADACGLPICTNIEDHVEVTEETAASWLDWLEKEHGSDFPQIQTGVEQVVKKRMQDIEIWKHLNAEQRSSLVAVVGGSKCAS